MKSLILCCVLALVSSCFDFSMQTGPDPHSIKFDKASFKIIADYFTKNNNIESFNVKNTPNTVPLDIIHQMKEIGILEFRNEEEYKVFFCGYGVVGKGWGFIFGNFDDKQIQQPALIQAKSLKTHLTFLEKLEDNWYRFAAD